MSYYEADRKMGRGEEGKGACFPPAAGKEEKQWNQVDRRGRSERKKRGRRTHSSQKDFHQHATEKRRESATIEGRGYS